MEFANRSGYLLEVKVCSDNFSQIIHCIRHYRFRAINIDLELA